MERVVSWPRAAWHSRASRIQFKAIVSNFSKIRTAIFFTLFNAKNQCHPVETPRSNRGIDPDALAGRLEARPGKQRLLNKVFRAFSYPDFRIMWFGACTSSIGTWMQSLAQSWLVYQLSSSSLYLGLDAFFGQIPIFMLSLFGGVFADRRSRRSLLLMSQAIQLSCAFTLAFLAATHVVRVWHIWCLSFTVGVAQSFGGPAYSALIPTLVAKEDLQNAIALNSIQFNLARVVGPALGGLALVKLGATWCFGLNGLSFLAVIASLLLIRPTFVPVKTQQSVLKSMREGIDFLLKREGMISLVALAFLATLLSYPMITFLPVMARDVFHGGPNTFTLFLCLSGAGSVSGALLVAGS